tara:strand:+ start:157 stop:663 length:507 start_codon:yes stop_codon:yes gene_type:complete
MTRKNLNNKSKAFKPRSRLFLVVADDSKELHQALYYAARRAATAGGEVALFRCIEPIEGQLWGGVTEIMEAEAEQTSKNLLQELSEYCEKLGAPKPKTFVRKGILHEELFNLIDKEKTIRVLVLGVSTEHGNPGPLINYVINKGSNECRVPITIVPGNLTDDQIDAII